MGKELKKEILKVENVTMQFGGVVAVNNLNLTVKEGEICSLIGPNGAGKTTAFNCVTGVYQPTNGIVSFEGNVIVRGTPKGKMKKEYAGENAELYASQRVIDPTPDEITKLGEHTGERDNHQGNREKHGLLDKECHASSPPFSVSALSVCSAVAAPSVSASAERFFFGAIIMRITRANALR